ncbi:MAG TPA: enolase C-terminal domain-like protein [Methylomirabilota bacterium]|jgi:mandelate racemase|nr:enolase C-terminal domain-like protein [Methylomirabilota bacterium]
MADAPRLHVRDVTARPVVAPLVPPLHTASGSLTEAPLLLVDLRTEEGPVGRAYLFGFQRLTLGPLRDLVTGLAETIAGRPVAPADLDRALRARLTLLGARGLQGMAIAALDLAAWDALAVAAGLPLASVLGGELRPIPAYSSLGMIPPGEAADVAARTVAAGFRGLKIKIGWPTLEQDLAVVRATRRALPDEVALMVDFNQSLSTAEALRRGRALDGEGLAWIEEPVRADDFRGAAEVARTLATPIQLGENLAGPFEMAEALRAGAADLVMPDVQQIGGVTGWLRAAALAHAAAIPCSSHLFIEASAHLLAVTPTCHWLEYLDIAAPVLAEPLRPVAGAIRAPARPGLGLAWDEAAVRRYGLA